MSLQFCRQSMLLRPVSVASVAAWLRSRWSGDKAMRRVEVEPAAGHKDDLLGAAGTDDERGDNDPSRPTGQCHQRPGEEEKQGSDLGRLEVIHQKLTLPEPGQAEIEHRNAEQGRERDRMAAEQARKGESQERQDRQREDVVDDGIETGAEGRRGARISSDETVCRIGQDGDDVDLNRDDVVAAFQKKQDDRNGSEPAQRQAVRQFRSSAALEDDIAVQGTFDEGSISVRLSACGHSCQRPGARWKRRCGASGRRSHRRR